MLKYLPGFCVLCLRCCVFVCFFVLFVYLSIYLFFIFYLFTSFWGDGWLCVCVYRWYISIFYLCVFSRHNFSYCTILTFEFLRAFVANCSHKCFGDCSEIKYSAIKRRMCEFEVALSWKLRHPFAVCSVQMASLLASKVIA